MFVQVIEFQSSKHDELSALIASYRESSAGTSLARRVVLGRSRGDDSRYVNVVFFDSYEEAMKNSDAPETSAFAEKMMALCDGPPTFHDLDVILDEAM